MRTGFTGYKPEAESLKYPCRRRIPRQRMGDDSLQVQLVESKLKNKARRPGRDTLSPKGNTDPVAQLGLRSRDLLELAHARECAVSHDGKTIRGPRLSIGDGALDFLEGLTLWVGLWLGREARHRLISNEALHVLGVPGVERLNADGRLRSVGIHLQNRVVSGSLELRLPTVHTTVHLCAAW